MDGCLMVEAEPMIEMLERMLDDPGGMWVAGSVARHEAVQLLHLLRGEGE